MASSKGITLARPLGAFGGRLGVSPPPATRRGAMDGRAEQEECGPAGGIGPSGAHALRGGRPASVRDPPLSA